MPYSVLLDPSDLSIEYDNAICTHLLIDAAIYQHIMKIFFTQEELGDMRTYMEKVANERLAARHTYPVVAVSEQGGG